MDGESVALLIKRVDECFDNLSRSDYPSPKAFQTTTLSPRGRFAPTASSLSLDAVLDDARIISLLSGLMMGPLRGQLKTRLKGIDLVVDLDQAWFRRQYAPTHYPPAHSPHSWHQDGALGFDFLAARGKEPQPHDLLEMVTCWIALTPCGVEAPGLELVDQSFDRLLNVESLQLDTLQSAFPSQTFFRPRMNAGDVLVFPGGTLHRTFVSNDMTRDRISLELRFFRRDSIPMRLSDDRFIGVGDSGISPREN